MSTRLEGLDAARGVLLVAMVAVHVVSAFGTAAQANVLHEQVGVFLISAGFVALSGLATAIGPLPAGAAALTGARTAGRLLLVMTAWSVALSLLRHVLALAAGGPEACSAAQGWTPPLRFDDLGILLPIALVALHAPLTRRAGRGPVIAISVLALGWMLLPMATDRVASGSAFFEPVFDVLVERRLTPFFTPATYVAIGLTGTLLARLSWSRLRSATPSPMIAVAARTAAIVASLPTLSHAVLDPVYAVLGTAAGGTATLLYWTGVVALFLLGFGVPLSSRDPGAVRARLLRLGQASLFVFVLHDVLLELDRFVLAATPLEKGAMAVAVFFVVDVAILLAAVRGLEVLPRVRAAAVALFLERAREGSRAVSYFGVAVIAGLLAVYTGVVAAEPASVIVLDDFERTECPAWWGFGGLSYAAVADDVRGGRHLEVRGRAAGLFAHGRGTFLARDLSGRRAFAIAVRGYGPGSGRIKVELCEDDNGNWEIEKDPRLYTPIFDDRFVHEIAVDWSGWREVVIPFDAFVDDNPGRGNDRFDPVRDGTSGGLLELQLLFTGAGPGQDEVRLDLDDVRWLSVGTDP